MSKQDQNRSKEEERKQNDTEPGGSHKERAPENQLNAAGQGHMQSVNSGEIKHHDPEKGGKKKQPAGSNQRDLDRNEGQERWQKS